MKNCSVYFVLIATTIFLSGCQSYFGPSSVKRTHPAYNQVINNMLNQQMLLNIVRLRYNDVPFFLTIGSVQNSLSQEVDIGISGARDFSSPLTTSQSLTALNAYSISPSLTYSYGDTPSISYEPLQGDDFLKSVISSIPLDSLLTMAQSGWSYDLIFSIGIERVNNNLNAPTASGPTPPLEPDYIEFAKFLTGFEEFLDKGGLVEMGTDPSDDTQLIILLAAPGSPELIDNIAKRLNFEVRGGKAIGSIIGNFVSVGDKNKLVIRARSINSILFYLSQIIQVPQKHVDEGLVTITQTRQGTAFDWSVTPMGKYFSIRVSDSFPRSAFLAVNYRDFWYYIADNDIRSKYTFLLLTQLFDLQAGKSDIVAPTLTLPLR